MKALALYAGPAALHWLQRSGLQPDHVATIPAAAGGPKGLILGPLDRFIFGEWLAGSNHPVDLVGGSIGAWRMATACLPNPATALSRLEHDYIHQDYAVPPGASRPTAASVSATFGRNLRRFFYGRVPVVLQHPHYRLHVVTSRGVGLLANPSRPATLGLGFGAAWAANAIDRRALGRFVQRVVFSSQGGLPFDPTDYPSQQVPLTDNNFFAAMQASCSIPFALEPVRNPSGAPPGCYWDGGVTDYHLHLRYTPAPSSTPGLVLYPHFQKAVVPGWLDKHLRWRHGATAALDSMLVLAPQPEWVARLPAGKLPDRTDFTGFGTDLSGRVRAWNAAVSAAEQLADEWAAWLHRPDPTLIQPL